MIRRTYLGHGYERSVIRRTTGLHCLTISRIVNSWNGEEAQFKIYLYMTEVASSCTVFRRFAHSILQRERREVCLPVVPVLILLAF